MSLHVWSWVLFSVSVTGLWISGTNPKRGWIFGISNQLVAWIPYGLVTGQWGTVATSAVFIALYGRSLYRWRHTDMTPAQDRRKEDELCQQCKCPTTTAS